jgi:hypothetical protein
MSKSTDVYKEQIISIFRVEQSACCLLQADFTLGLLCCPEDGDDIFLRILG